MIYTFNFINDVTIKTNHFMREMKSVLIKITKNYTKM